MKIDYVADIHADFWVRFNGNQIKYKKGIVDFIEGTIPKEKSEYLVIAGDIANTNVVSKWVLEQYSNYYKKVFMVMGNHDYYLDSKSQKGKYKKDSRERKKELEKFIEEKGNIILLEGFEVYEVEGKKIAGDTNWYDAYDEEVRKETLSNDWTDILKLLIGDLHQKAEKYYSELDKVDLIVTHVPPIIYPSYKEKEVMKVYYNILDVTKNKTNHWIAGHMHAEEEFEENGVTFHINSWGYPKTKSHKTNEREKEIKTKKIKTLEI